MARMNKQRKKMMGYCVFYKGTPLLWSCDAQRYWCGSRFIKHMGVPHSLLKKEGYSLRKIKISVVR